MKAFLSHSSRDKYFVDPVAKALGRQYCVYDVDTFESHEEFVLSIRRGLDSSAVFVLFASQASLESIWVSFEVREAEYKLIQANIQKLLIFLIGAQIDHDSLPGWMQRCLVRPCDSPKVAAREIRAAVEDTVRARRQPLFVGRQREITELQRQLYPGDIEVVPRVLVAHGLDGIGRKTLLERVASDQLALKRLLPISVGAGDTARDIAVKLGLQFEVHRTPDGLKDWTDRIRNGGELIAFGAVHRAVRLAMSAKELLTFVDDGGVLDDDGRLRSEMAEVLMKLVENESAYCAIVCRRRPGIPAELSSRVCEVRIRPLEDDDSRFLLTQLSRVDAVPLKAEDLRQLMKQVAGYPPSAYYAMQLARQYGVDVILANQEPLVSFRAEFFLRQLTRRLALTPAQRQLLAILAYYGPLPLAPLAEAARQNPETVARSIVALIDLALIDLHGNRLYSVSRPIGDAVRRILPIQEVPHGQVAKCLKEFLETCEPDDRRLELFQALYRAKRWTGEADDANWVLGFASDTLALAWSAYHERQYDRAIGFAREVLEARPDETSAREVLVRALIREERFDEAKQQLEPLRRASRFREYYFLLGFMHRVKLDHGLAIDAYENAIARGRNGVAVHREVALCYNAIGDLERAKEAIAAARRIDPGNRFVVDLEATVAIELKDQGAAHRALELLKDIDDSPFYLHRKSTYCFAFGSRHEAVNAAEEAVRTSQRPTFAMLAQLVKAQIGVGRLTDAGRTLKRLEGSFPRIRSDIKIGLRCKWELATGHPENALVLSEKFRRKHVPVQRALRRDAIEGALARGLVSGDDMVGLAQELEVLRADLSHVEDPWPSADDDIAEDHE